MVKILIVFGTRPEVIKVVPAIKELRKHPDKFIVALALPLSTARWSINF